MTSCMCSIGQVTCQPHVRSFRGGILLPADTLSVTPVERRLAPGRRATRQPVPMSRFDEAPPGLQRELPGCHIPHIDRMPPTCSQRGPASHERNSSRVAAGDCRRHPPTAGLAAVVVHPIEGDLCPMHVQPTSATTSPPATPPRQEQTSEPPHNPLMSLASGMGDGRSHHWR